MTTEKFAVEQSFTQQTSNKGDIWSSAMFRTKTSDNYQNYIYLYINYDVESNSPSNSYA